MTSSEQSWPPGLCPARIPSLIATLGVDRLIVLAADLDRQLARLEATIAENSGDRAALADTLHRLRGTAGTLGLPGLAAAIASLEDGLRRQGPGPVREQLDRVGASRRDALLSLSTVAAGAAPQGAGGTNR